MDTSSLPALADQHLESARTSSAGRSAVTVYGGQEHDLRQTLIAMTTGTVLGEHDTNGEATLQVLRGRVTLRAGEDEWSLAVGDLRAVPQRRHDLSAEQDSVVLLTVATRADRPTS